LRAEAIGVDTAPKSAANRPKTVREGRVTITDFAKSH
jgi:hypothetical protein